MGPWATEAVWGPLAPSAAAGNRCHSEGAGSRAGSSPQGPRCRGARVAPVWEGSLQAPELNLCPTQVQRHLLPRSRLPAALPLRHQRWRGLVGSGGQPTREPRAGGSPCSGALRKGRTGEGLQAPAPSLHSPLRALPSPAGSRSSLGLTKSRAAVLCQ